MFLAVLLTTTTTFLVAESTSNLSLGGTIACLLIVLSLLLLSRYSLRTPVLSGSLVLVFALMIGIHVSGALPRSLPIMSINPRDGQWVMYLIGFVSLIIGAALGAARPSVPGRVTSVTDVDLADREPGWNLKVLLPVVGVAMFVGIVNYATGSIPLLAGDVNGARLNGNYGALGRFWPLVFPVLQVGLMVSVVLISRGRATLLWLLAGLASASILVLSGGRSLLIIALLAVGVVFVEYARPRLSVIALVSAVGLALFGLVGAIRTASSANASAAAAFLSERNLDGWFGSTDLSLQTGPRVMSLALDSIQGQTLNGAVLLGDIQNFFVPAIARSDRVITALLGRDASVLGGLPPTIWGGFALDFGLIGIIIGGLIVGAIAGFSRTAMLKNWGLGATIWFGYFAAYLLLSSYSYISFRPSWIVVLILALITRKGITVVGITSPDGFKVQRVPRRSRASH